MERMSFRLLFVFVVSFGYFQKTAIFSDPPPQRFCSWVDSHSTQDAIFRSGNNNLRNR